jgi:hypothetical protein
MILEILTEKTCYISTVVHKLMGTFQGSCRSSLFSENCFFKEHFNEKELFMKMNTSIFVRVHAINSFPPGKELLINYKFCRPPTSHQKCLALGLRLDVPSWGIRKT